MITNLLLYNTTYIIKYDNRYMYIIIIDITSDVCEYDVLYKYIILRLHTHPARNLGWAAGATAHSKDRIVVINN